MAEVEKYVFDYKEIVTELIKKQSIHEGNWALILEFGIAAANISPQLSVGSPPASIPNTPPTEVTPAAIVLVQKIGIARTDHVSNLSVDAAVVNPKPKRSAKK